MAEEIKEERDEIVEDIEASMTKAQPGRQPGYRMIIHSNGAVEITTGELAMQAILGNPHYSCCCCWG